MGDVVVKWGFVDYENTGSLEELDATSYERLLIFFGPKNKNLKLGDLSTTEFTKIELIRIKTNGANNLDFHLSFYLGRYHETADNSVEFHIISNDDGFNGIINHIRTIGRKCKKIQIRRKIKEQKQNIKDAEPLSKCAELVVSRLKKMDGKKRPRKKASLINWIKSQCNHIKPEINANTIYNELTGNSFVFVSSSGISYKI